MCRKNCWTTRIATMVKTTTMIPSENLPPMLLLAARAGLPPWHLS